MNVRVWRNGRSEVIDVPIALLTRFQVDWRSPGRHEPYRYPRLTAIMSCELIPDAARETFGHSCKHGPPPHHIRVLVEIAGKPRTRNVYRVQRLAFEAERLASAFREGRTFQFKEADDA